MKMAKERGTAFRAAVRGHGRFPLAPPSENSEKGTAVDAGARNA
jgi:hypothetical protein